MAIELRKVVPHPTGAWGQKAAIVEPTRQDVYEWLQQRELIDWDAAVLAASQSELSVAAILDAALGGNDAD